MKIRRYMGVFMLGLVNAEIFLSIFKLKGMNDGFSFLMTCLFSILFLIGLNLIIDNR